MGGVEVFDAFELEAGSLDLFAEGDQLGGGPEFVGIAGHSPGLVFSAGGLVLRGVGFALLEVVDEVDDDVRTACLHGEGSSTRH